MYALCFLLLLPIVSSQVATPPRPIGFVYNGGSATAKVHIDMYIDLVCPDSRDAWPGVKEAALHYGPDQLRLNVFLFPLPYHQNAFYASRAAYVIHKLSNGTKTFDWIESILTEQLNTLRDVNFHNKSDADLLELFASLVTDMGFDTDRFKELTDRRTANDYERLTRVMWKYACTRGVAGTPTFFINGIANLNIGSKWTLADWKTFIDPLLVPQILDDVSGIASPSEIKPSGNSNIAPPSLYSMSSSLVTSLIVMCASLFLLG